MRISREPGDPDYTENFAEFVVILNGIIQAKVKSADEERGKIVRTDGAVLHGIVKINAVKR